MTDGYAVLAERRVSFGMRATFLAALAGLGASLAVSLYNLKLLSSAADDVDRAERAMYGLEDLIDAITDAEAGQRGYLLTGNASYLAPYHAGIYRTASLESDVPRLLGALAIPADDPAVRALIDAVAAKRLEMANTLEVFDEQGGRAALSIVLTDVGQKLMDDVQDRREEVQLQVDARLRALREQSSNARRFATVSTLATGFLTVVVLAVAFSTADREQLLRRAAHGRAEDYAQRLTDLADVGLRLNRARDRASLLDLAASEARRLLAVEVAAAVAHAPEPASAVAVGSRSRALATWRPDRDPHDVGLQAERDGGFAVVHGVCDPKALITRPTDLRHAIAAAFTDRRGAVFGHVIAAEPISDTLDAMARLTLVQLAQEVSVAWENVLLLEELQQAALEREHFMAVLGHELRNPLNAIAGASQVLSRTVLPGAPLTELVAMLDRQVVFMRRMVEDLLDVARLERGKIELERTVLDVGALVRQVADDFRTGRPEGDRLVVDVPAQHVYVDGDAARLAQCVNNLLDNALKFGEHRPIMLGMTIEAKTVTLTVRDEGSGIPPAQLRSIFDRYAQGVDGARRDGLGLGLALVRGVALLHGGEVYAVSDGPGKGATFVLRVPRVEAQGVVRTAARSMPPHARTILVADDRADARLALSELLRADGHQVITASSGEEALQVVTRDLVSLVLCDISMGAGLDGYEVARAIRANPATRGIAVVAVTGFGTHAARERSREAGFDLHLTKPVDMDVIRVAIRELDARRVSAAP